MKKSAQAQPSRHLTFPKLLLATLTVLVSSQSLANPASPAPIPLIDVGPKAAAQGFVAEATVEAQYQATVAAQVPGRVLEVKADAGQSVKKGALLMRLDTREASEQSAAAQAQYQNAKLQHARQQSLLNQKFVSPAALDKAKAELDAAAASLAAAQAGQSHGSIVSPMEGVVARRLTELGEMASLGKPLFLIYDPASLRITASVPQARLAEVRQAQGADIEFPEQKLRLAAKSIQLLPTADSSTHASQVRLYFTATPAQLAQITPGMAARVQFLTGQAQKLTLPQSAILHRGEVSAVYVYSPDGRFSMRQLRLGEASSNGEVEVLAGLSKGERIAADPQQALLLRKTTPAR